MIESLEIENFRCFDKLAVNDFGQMNVVVGESAAGKTSLLEAISFGLGAAIDLPLKYRVWRGLPSALTLPPTRASYEALWEDLFFQYDQKRTVRISLRGSDDVNRSLELGYRPQTAATIPMTAGESKSAPAGPLDSSAITPITFEWTYAPGESFLAQPLPTGTGVSAGHPKYPSLAAFFSAAFMAVSGPTEAANQFSELSKKRKDAPVRRALKAVFPQIDNLSVENDAGNNVLYCHVPWMKVKAPVALVSSGVNKLLFLLIGIATVSKGVVLVDELENSFYYNSYPAVWKSLMHFSQRFKVQLVVSTHSMECLRATMNVLPGNEDKFRLMRVERKKART